MLGLGISSILQQHWSDVPAAVIDDYFWEIASVGNLTPLASGTVINVHDTWDLDGTDYMPRTTATVSDEGYWDLDGTDIQPLDV